MASENAALLHAVRWERGQVVISEFAQSRRCRRLKIEKSQNKNVQIEIRHTQVLGMVPISGTKELLSYTWFCFLRFVMGPKSGTF